MGPRYLMYGDISTKAAHMLSLPKVSDFFTRLIQRVSPKSYQQAFGEVYVTQKFLENFCGDQVRFLARSFAVPEIILDNKVMVFVGPMVAIITPFNFPLEIPVLQLMGALYMGNKPVLKVDSKVSIVMEQMLRLLHTCGLPVEDVDFINSDGKTMNKLLLEANPRMTLFTGSSRVAEKLALDLKGRVKLEDAGFDWKILGPDVHQEDYTAWVCDQDAYACSGQKCSAQSLLFMHENWSKTSLLSKLKDLAERRKLTDLTIGPVLTVTTDSMLEHVNKLLEIPGSKLLFGGRPLEDHSIPSIYGAIKPTAVYVPLEEIMKDNNFELVTKEIFGPFQIITDYKNSQLSVVLDALERMHNHLTAAVVSNDPLFVQEVIGKTVNGTTYAGLRARTTGAPQNHWFGPAGDPRGAGIGTPEAIKLNILRIAPVPVSEKQLLCICKGNTVYNDPFPYLARSLWRWNFGYRHMTLQLLITISDPCVALTSTVASVANMLNLAISTMTLLEVIKDASINSKPLDLPLDYPIVLNPDSILPNLKPKDIDESSSSLIKPLIGWNVPPTDAEITDINKKFFTQLNAKFMNTNNLDKGEFISSLKSYLENIRDKVGVVIEVDTSSSDYNRILIDKLGTFVGKDVAGLVLNGCVSLEIWDVIEALIVNVTIEHSCYSNLITKLVEKRGLICSVCA
ncbi:unnamed protein product [Sphenostylis stenocarpa]|uniref:Aldehyde dehydrogenase domain-containing protein n=1 Tax=Sphenostylis stenocarpa TaxID=92480 RepID=A0AA86SAY3_9FABA|nr:unnamed protein product [Sphenostylis stenocarpa]